MRHFILPALFLLYCVSIAIAADAPKTRYDVPYAEPAKGATSLDVYAPATGTDHPIIVWIHGGGWRKGDKAHVQAKPEALNRQGFVFVSINYRLNSEATYAQQAGDVAKAIRWVHDHAREFGGSPEHIFVMGHSAGAHLAALVATDHRYLVAEGLKLSNLQGAILLDGAGYDIPKQIEQARLPRMKEMYRTVFGTDLSKQQDASPITHVTLGKGIPPFLILHVADRRDSRQQSEALAERLKSAGTSAKVVAAEGKNHATINRELGNSGDVPTEALFEFLKKQMGEHGK
jgi:arylformamidase